MEAWRHPVSYACNYASADTLTEMLTAPTWNLYLFLERIHMEIKDVWRHTSHWKNGFHVVQLSEDDETLGQLKP